MSFDAIYQAALEEDVDKLYAAMRFTSIDVWKKGRIHFSAGTQLAYKGEFSAVEFLLKHGANIDLIAEGAAMGIHEGSDVHKDFCIVLIARGANKSWVGRGAAIGGSFDYCRQLIDEGADKNVVAEGAALGVALGREEDFRNELIAEGVDLRRVAIGAALGANLSKSSDYCHTLIAIEDPEIANCLAQGIGVVGNLRDVEIILDAGANSNALVYGAAMGGQDEYCLELMKKGGISSSRVIEGAAMRGHVVLSEVIDVVCISV